MRQRLITFVDSLLRGFGQLCLTNNRVSGLLVALGLLVAAPPVAALAAVGALVVNGVCVCFAAPRTLLQSGLTAVNGVLLGCLWSLCPEVKFPVQLLITALGSLLIAALIVAGISWSRWKLPLFTLPYVLVAWLALWGLEQAGLYDRPAFTGWTALAARDYERAVKAFASIECPAPRVLAYRADGQGWAAFHQRDYATAVKHFTEAASRDSQFSDPLVGQGWSLLKQGDSAAAADCFRAALVLRSRSADVWNGLGWIALGEHDFVAADTAFVEAAWRAPFCAESYFGLAQTRAGAGDTAAAQTSFNAGTLLDRFCSTRLQYVPASQWLGWALFVLAIAWHSRIALGAVAVVLMLVAAANSWLPGWATTWSDLHCTYNLLAMAVLLTGVYLPLRWWSMSYTALILALTVLIWRATAGVCGVLGLPLLILPLNVALVVTRRGLQTLQRRGLTSFSPAAELTASSAEIVLLYERKARIAQACWDALKAAERNPRE